MAASRSPLAVAFGGLVALAAGIGIGRFVYTPILPFMAEELGLDPAEGGLVASANFLGYLLGALAAARVPMPGGRRRWLFGALAVSAATTGAMGLTAATPVFGVLRFAGGMASAYVIVLSAGLVLDRLAAVGRRGLSWMPFSGVGVGIAISAVLVSGMGAAGGDWQMQWLASGAVAHRRRCAPRRRHACVPAAFLNTSERLRSPAGSPVRAPLRRCAFPQPKSMRCAARASGSSSSPSPGPSGAET